MNSGSKAEEVAAQYLVQNGHEIIDRNWKNKWCEIDIVSKKDDTIYFSEVKYRKNNYAGNAIDYITKPKLRQMHRGAISWIKSTGWDGSVSLCAVAVEGMDFKVIDFIDNLDT